MLRNLHKTDTENAAVRMADIDTVQPFRSGLEYSSPARGTWTIAHTSMLIPHSHQIFVCPEGCLRGVVLSAAEYGGLDRFSMVTVQEEDFLNEKMEQLFIDGVTDIIRNLPSRPPAVLVYSCCIHHFIGADMAYVFRTLRERFPDIDIIECFMYPTMRKSKYTPDELMWRSLYDGLKMQEKEERSVSVIGSDFAFDRESELAQMFAGAGWKLRDICTCSEYQEYLDMGKSTANIYTWKTAEAGARELERRLGQKAVYFPVSFDYEEIRQCIRTAEETFGLTAPDPDAAEKAAESALESLRSVLNGMPVVIDYTAVSRPLGLAALFISHGIRVRAVYADAILPEEEKALEYLQANAPDLPLRATINFRCRTAPRDEAEKEGGSLLAIGQKAAYFSGTKHFVNLIQNGGLWGFSGIVKLCRMAEEAAGTESDVQGIISVKGWGCCG
jgi:hypothetical protein